MTLHDGTRLVVRPSRPDDVEGLVALFGALDLEDRHRRFFSAYRPTRRWLEALAAVDESEGVQLVAEIRADDGTSRLVAEAGYRLLPDGDGELAMTVDPAWRGWLGPYLLDALVDAAARRSVPNLEADVLCDNRAMVALLRARGDAVLDRQELALLRIVIGTGGDTPTWAPGTTGPRVLVETPGGVWHAAPEARAHGLAVMACPGPSGRHRPCPALRGEPCPLAAGADAVVIANAPDDDEWRALADAHRRLHPGVPVCLEVRDAGPDDRTDPPTVRGPAVVGLLRRLVDEPNDPEAGADGWRGR